MTSTETVPRRFDGRWVLRTILIWFAVGIVLGVLFVLPLIHNLGAVQSERCEITGEWCEGMGIAIAEVLSPAFGAAWGLVAGALGAWVGAATRSPKAYAATMTALALLALGGFSLVTMIGSSQFVASAVLTVLAGGAVGGIAWMMSRPTSAGNSP